MIKSLRSLQLLIVLSLSIKILIQAQDQNKFIYHGFQADQDPNTQDPNQFIYNGFHGPTLNLDGAAEIHSNGLLQLTNTSKRQKGHAFYPIPIKFNNFSLSFSTYFVCAIRPEFPNLGGNGLAFTISQSMDFSQAIGSQFLGLFNTSSNGLSSNHVFAVELDTIMNPEFEDIDSNHVGIDVNSLRSNKSATAAYFSNTEGVYKNFTLISGSKIEVWIDYNGFEKILNVTLAPNNVPRPKRPLLSANIDLSPIFLETMYVGFSSSTGSMQSRHYILGWSFNKSGQAQTLDLSNLPPLPKERKSREKMDTEIRVSTITVSILLITIGGAFYFVRKKRFEEIHEDWEREYGPQRFSYRDLYKATRGFRSKELLGTGGFGEVYRGVLSSPKKEVAVKKVSHDSKQGMKEFVAEIASMGRLRHRNLVQLLGYCRRRGELILVYDYMPNGSLDKFLFNNENLNLNWAQRYRILKGVASGLLYLHEEWEQIVLHRDVKSSNVLLDGDMNARLGDFGLARLYDHGANPETTHVVGTIGYLAPELARTGRATTCTDVFAFGVFMLEVACGRRPIQLQRYAEEMILVEMVFESWKKGDIIEMRDTKLGDDFVAREMELVLKLGLVCSHSNPMARPTMRQVMQYLDGDAILPEVHFDGASFGMVSMGEPFSEFAMSFPSTLSVETVLSETHLSNGR